MADDNEPSAHSSTIFPDNSPSFADSTERPPMAVERPASEAGPSRARRHSTPTSFTAVPSSESHLRPASPGSALATTPPRPSTPHLDLATYPTQTLLRLLASLLQQIATANDQLRPDLEDTEDTDRDRRPDEETSLSSRSASRSSHSHPNGSPTTALFAERHMPSDPMALTSDPDKPLFTASRTSLAHPSSLLSFHARHVPSTSIEAYLLRILKYCPTTNEVFLGLLVYFDRMSKLGTPLGVGGAAAGAQKGPGRGFAIVSYNVHRLVIAGVTVASKFFSDVFYTNSRYAKVGGLPSHELNQLELQFLLLNNFKLMIPPEEMQRYGDRLLGYWEARDADLGSGEAETTKDAERGRSTTRQSASVQGNTSIGETTTGDSAQDKSAQDKSAQDKSTQDKSAQDKSQGGIAHRNPADDGSNAPSEQPQPGKKPADTAKVPSQGELTTAATDDSRPPLPPLQAQTSEPPVAPAASPLPTSEPPASALPATVASVSPEVVSRGKERTFDRMERPADSTPVTANETSAGLAAGLRDWVRGEDMMGVVGGRMTSPMRD